MMFQTMNQIDLEQSLIVSVVTFGLEGYKKLPEDFRSTVFSVGSHSKTFKVFAAIVQQNLPLDFHTVSERAEANLAGELASMVANTPPASYLTLDQLEHAARELIRRAETRINEHEGDTIGPLSDIPVEFMNALSSEQKVLAINVAQDFVADVFGYGIKVGGRSYWLTSRREVIPLEDLAQKGVSLTSNKVYSSGFSHEGIRAFIDGSPLETKKLFQTIREYIRRFIVLKNDNGFTFLTLWTMATYIFRVFRYFPYVHLTGEKNSGKTFLMEILEPLAFNGHLLLDPTEAVIFRYVNTTSATLFIDEVEKLRKQDREKYGAVMSILNSGFSKTGSVARMGGKNRDEFHSFSTYSPKMFAGIGDLYDVLRDRMIEIFMIRRLEREPIQRYTASAAIREAQMQIRDDLYRFGLTFGPKLADLYNEKIDSIVGLDQLSNRAFDVWMPIFVLANIVDEDRADGAMTVTDEMIGFSKRHLEAKREDDQADNETVRLLIVLERMTQELPPFKKEGNVLFFDTSEAFGFFQHQEEFSWIHSKPLLTRKLRKVEVQGTVVKVQGVATRMYMVNLDVLRDYFARYISSQGGSETVT